MGENFWKDAYQDTWVPSSEREKYLAKHLFDVTGKKLLPAGLGAESTQYISGCARRNGYEKGDADFVVDGTNIYIEVTGPLVTSVKPSAPLWFRPDKIENAISHPDHDVFLVHHCMSADLWRVIHVDETFKKRYRNGKFSVVTPFIRGNYERYVEIDAGDPCIKAFDTLVAYILQW